MHIIHERYYWEFLYQSVNTNVQTKVVVIANQTSHPQACIVAISICITVQTNSSTTHVNTLWYTLSCPELAVHGLMVACYNVYLLAT